MIVLDTHVLIWWVNGEIERFKSEQILEIENRLKRKEVRISAITLWEIALLVSRQRLKLSGSITVWLRELQQIYGIESIPLTEDILIESVNLPGVFHPDPADRMIVATCRVKGGTLISFDQKITQYQHVAQIR